MAYPESRGQVNKTLDTGRTAYVGDGTDLHPLKSNTTGEALVGISETIQTELIATQNIAASTQLKSSVLDLTGIKKASIFIFHGRANTVAFGTNGTEYRVEMSAQSAGNDTWNPVATILCASTACLAVAASADVAASGTTVVVTSGTSIPARADEVFWANTVSAASSEWMKVLSVSGTVSFIIEDGLRYGQDSDTNIFTQAQRFPLLLDVEAFTRMRVVANNNASGTTQAIYSRVACITER